MLQSDYRTIKNITKIYPNKVRVVQYNRAYQVRIGAKSMQSTKQKDNLLEKLEDFRAERRAKTEIKDIIICNKFDLFATFTFDKKKVDRFNISMCKMHMYKWLRAQQRKYGHFHYIIIPEFHKDGKAIHFHALLKNYNGPLKDSGILHKGRHVYNFIDYQIGFSSAEKIDSSDEDYEKVGNYVTKYVTKDMPTFSGKKRYWVSQGLERPEKVINGKLHHDIFDNDAKSSDKIYCATSFTFLNNDITIFEWRHLNGNK